jgi:hypothetical protein
MNMNTQMVGMQRYEAVDARKERRSFESDEPSGCATLTVCKAGEYFSVVMEETLCIVSVDQSGGRVQGESRW